MRSITAGSTINHTDRHQTLSPPQLDCNGQSGIQRTRNADQHEISSGFGCGQKGRNTGGLNKPHSLFGNKVAAQAYDKAVFKVAADELILTSGAQVLFHSQAVGVSMNAPGNIKALLVEIKSGRLAILGKVFIDCSVDGDLAAHAGAPFEKGRDSADKKVMMYPSTMFRVHGVDAANAGDAWNHFEAMMEKAEKDGKRFPRKTPIIRPQKKPAEW